MSTFSTSRFQLAIYLHVDGRLRFLRCERVSDTEVRFLFDDPDGQGDQKEYEFDRGAAVSAISLFASQKFLRRKMSNALDSNNRENFYAAKAANQANHNSR